MKQRNCKTRLLLLALALALSGCSGGGPTPGSGGPGSGDGAALSTVVLKSGQQGQSGGFADYDDDGIADLMVGAPYALVGSQVGAVLVYRGTVDGFDANPTWVLTGDDNLGYSFANMGDLDGDGKADYAVGAYNGGGSDVSMSGSVTIYKGGSAGKVIAKLAGQAPLNKFGLTVAAGDFNGDGRREIVVGAPFNSPTPALYQRGAVYIHPSPYGDANRAILPATSSNGGLGNAIAAGDVNGDGIDDLLAGAAGKVLIYYGKTGFNPTTNSPDVVISSTDGGFGTAIAVLGDLNGDGLNDIAIGAAKATVNGNLEQGRLHIVKGGNGRRTINLATAGGDLLTRIDGAAYFDRFGANVTAVGAIPDDGGKPNFAVAAIHADRDGATSLATGLASGKVYLFKGKDLTVGGNTPITKASVFNGPEGNMHYGASMSRFSKNGPKLLIGAPTVKRQSGGVYAVSMESGSPSAPIFHANGPGSSTTGGDCCAARVARGGR